MDKMKMQTNDLADENFKKLKELFPNAVTEAIDENGEVVRAIDKDVLRQEINAQVVEGPEERYQFTWPGKRESIRLAAAPIAAALRPCREESVNFDTTENVYIEGDNLDVLKLLRETYLGRIKMIYIDPPYNTGNDFIYEDDFSEDKDEFLLRNNQYDDQGNRLVQNTESNGRFHTDWLNMIYPRLKISKDLLKDDGAIFISIGQNEIGSLTLLCNEIFGEDNQLGICSRLMKTGGNKGRFFSPNIDYVLVYSKDINSIGDFKGDLDPDLIKKLYNKVETEGPRKGELFRPFGLYQSSLDERPNQRYFIECPDGSLVIPPGHSMPNAKKDGEKVLPIKGDGCWRWSVDRYRIERANRNILFVESPNGVLIDSTGKKSKWNIYTKIWLSEREEDGQTPTDFIQKWENRHSAKELTELGLSFDFAKPSELIKYLYSLMECKKEDIIMDFFSGSSSAAHAVLKKNSEDNGRRKFIMVQLPEKMDSNDFSDICELGKERIRRAGKKIKDDNPLTTKNLDIGFRVFKLDSSNMKDVYYSPFETPQKDLLGRVDNIKEGRTPEDLLFQVMLEFGIPLSSKIKESVIAGKKVFNVEDNYLIACFDDAITEETITAIAKEKPQYVVLRDSGFKTDSVAANFEQIFATYSPDTTRRIL